MNIILVFKKIFEFYTIYINEFLLNLFYLKIYIILFSLFYFNFIFLIFLINVMHNQIMTSPVL
jgi:hypothetical protein